MINKILSFLSKSYKIALLWTPGHAGLQGNETADQLAKEGASEALNMPDDYGVVTLQEVKMASHRTCLNKWQWRWENSSTGRRFYEFFPLVADKRGHDHPDKHIYTTILQLQTGYSKLNGYRNSIGQTTSPLCECGVLETPEHFLLDCEMFENHREELLISLQRACGIARLDTHTLLGNEDHEVIAEWRSLIQTELGKYITATQRFADQASVQAQP